MNISRFARSIESLIQEGENFVFQTQERGTKQAHVYRVTREEGKISISERINGYQSNLVLKRIEGVWTCCSGEIKKPEETYRRLKEACEFCGQTQVSYRELK